MPVRDKEGNVLFNDALNTFYLRLYGVGSEIRRGGGGSTCTGRYKGVQAVRLGSVAGGGCVKVIWNLECPVGLSQKRICVHFNEGNWAQFG